MSSNDKPDKIQQQLKICNCQNSKCMKLYCECFAARHQCSRLCRCFQCKNQNITEHPFLHKTPSNGHTNKIIRQELNKQLKGCSCRKSFCIKKYCECFQEGVLCGQHCKCVDCQNNQSMTNRSVLANLKQKGASSYNSCLYPIILSQSAEHLQHLVAEENPLNIDDREMEAEVYSLFRTASDGNIQTVINQFINILKRVDNSVSKIEIWQSVKQQMQQ